MIKRRDWPSKLIVTAQFMIGLVALLGLAAFVSLNPYLITVFAFAQVFIIAGVVLFIIALIASRSVLVAGELARKETRDIRGAEDRLYLLTNGRRHVLGEASSCHPELDDRDTLGRKSNRGAR
jgi:hypothetical protein